MARLHTEDVVLAYDGGEPVVDGLSLYVPDRRITRIVGPNACGKSTLLRALSRLLSPRAGQVVLDGRMIRAHNTKEVARRLGLLPRSPSAPEGLTVEDLVARGRYPHQRLFQQWRHDDEAAVEEALRLTRTDELRHRPVDQLSGGQRQRVWVAMALAQQTPIMLLDVGIDSHVLDDPTTGSPLIVPIGANPTAVRDVPEEARAPLVGQARSRRDVSIAEPA